MQKHKKFGARILSMALSVAMVATMLPATVFAAEGDALLDTSSVGEIKSFDKLEGGFIPSVGENAPNHVYALSVNLNTPFEDLQLPTELTAMVARTTTVSAPAEDEVVVDSGEPSEPAEDEVVVDSGEPSEPAEDEVVDEDIPLAPEPDGETTITTEAQEIISVTWNSDREYVSDENGQFIYTAVLPEDYILADGVELPQIYVFVGKQARGATIEEIVVGGSSPTNGYETANATTLQKAFTNIPDGGTVKIGANIVLGDVCLLFWGPKTATLDIGEYNITHMEDGDDLLTGPAIGLYDAASLTITGTTGTISGNQSAVIMNKGTGTLTISGGTIKSVGNSVSAISSTSTSALYITGGTVTCDVNCYVITNRATGKITISGDAELIGNHETIGTIFFLKVPGSEETDKIILEIKDNASVTNTNEKGYAVHFKPDTGVTGLTVLKYYTKAETATVGKIFPAAVAVTVNVNGSTTEVGGTTLEAAIAASTVAPTAVTSLKITAGTVTEADWKYLKDLTAMTSFEIDSAVTDVANIPAAASSASIFPKSIVTVTVPQAITIGNFVFDKCTALTTVSFPNATSIGIGAFNGCTALTTVSFPKATSIELGAFSGCTTLTTASFPLIGAIEAEAFLGCNSLTTLKLGAISPSVQYDAFKNCPSARALGYLAADGTALTGTDLTAAQANYKAVNDGTSDGLWFGWTIVPPFHTITASAETGGSISPSGTVEVNKGEDKTFTISPNNNYSIASILVDGVSQGAIGSYTFNNVTGNHTISATFRYNGGGGSSGGGSIAPPKIETSVDNTTTTGTIPLNTTVKDGSANATISGSIANAAIKAAQERAENSGVAGGEIVVAFRVESKNADTVTTNLPLSTQKALINNQVDTVLIQSDSISLSFNLDAIKSMNSTANANISIVAQKTSEAKMDSAAASVVGDRVVFDISAFYGQEKITNFNGNNVTITLPYTLRSGENKNNIHGYFINDSGKAVRIENSKYNSSSKTLTFKTSHFSNYAVGYDKSVANANMTSNWSKDSSGDWYYTDKNGVVASAKWVLDGGKWYYIGNSTVMYANRWHQHTDGNWYYLGTSGAMATSRWIQTNGSWYYVNQDGVMLKSTTTPDGYRVNRKGAWVK